MIRKSVLAVGTLAVAFITTAGLVLAQTATPSPTATPISSPTASPKVPSGAPATGMGGV